ncbi:hypothetical protein HY312_00400 [Candidatus Saccharibacteria bacterium]|nr:hypothetical protein [Candidatus Saccharibacteria bacterium]
MAKSSQKQIKSMYIIIVIVLILGVALSAVFIGNFTKQDQAIKVSNSNSKMETKTEIKMETKMELKTYTSISGSGLTFDYPSSWSFKEPTEQQISREDSKATLMVLYSHEPSVVDGKGSISTSNVCVTFNEMQGNWPFRSQPLGNSDKIADFTVGQNAVSLVESKKNLETSTRPAMQIVNQGTSSKHGGSYIALNEDYFLLATASKDCFISDNAKKIDVTPEIEEAHEILKSVRIKE